MGTGLERRGLLGAGGTTLAMLGLRPVATEGKKNKQKRKGKGNAGGRPGGFRALGAGEEAFFAVEGGTENEGISLCPEGSRAISGSFAFGNIACVVTEFTAVDDSFTGWKLAIRCPPGEDSDANAVIAICIS